MKLGFLILTHKKPDPVFYILIKNLLRIPNVEVVIHHDFFQEPAFDLATRCENISFVKPYYRTHWSHINNVLATIDGLTILSERMCDWMITLSPQCLPLKRSKEIVKFFSNATVDGYLGMHKVRDRTLGSVDDSLLRGMCWQPWFRIPFISRRGNFYRRTIYKEIKADGNPFINGDFEYWQGSNYFALNRKAVNKIIAEDSRINSLIQFYLSKVSSLPDMHPCPQETVIQTFLGNQNDLRFKFDSLHYINWYSSQFKWSPNELSLQDLGSIKASQHLFARKFSEEKSMDLIKQLEFDPTTL